MPKGYPVDLTGRQFWDWTVLYRHSVAPSGHVSYMCQCACGRQVPVQAGNLTQGNSKRCRSCGNSREFSSRWNQDNRQQGEGQN